MLQAFKHILTGKDNQTYDTARVLLVAGVISFIVFTGYCVFTKGQFNAMDYGAGFGSILGGGCLGIGLKKDTEPQ